MTSRAAHRGRRSGDRRSVRPWLLACLPVLLVLVAEPAQRALRLPDLASTAVVDVVEALVPAVAALLCALRALRERTPGDHDVRGARGDGGARGTSARGWWVLAAACASWATGQAVWTVYEVVLQTEVPTPSWADVGFLGFSALAPLGVLVLGRGAVRSTSRLRSVLDGVIIAGALFLLSWTLVLRVVVAEGAASVLALSVSVAYPIGDVIVVTVALAVLSRTRASGPLVAITAGAGLMAMSDSLFVYLSATGEFATGGLLDALWTAAFAVIAVATTLRASARRPAARVHTSLLLQGLPYLPFGLATVVVVIEASRRPLAGTALASLVLLMTMVFVRQALVVVDNVQLTRDLQQRSSALAQMAFTDTLTGVANRASFTAALDAALAERTPVVAAFCDLDSFKAVNDVCGHATGDALLVAVAARLRQVVRGDDVVARLGGDEFAVLVRDDDGGGADGLRERLATALSVPFRLDPHLAGAAGDPAAQQVLDAVSVSLGAVSSTELGAPAAERLLHEADQRMYVAKRAARSARASEAQR